MNTITADALATFIAAGGQVSDLGPIMVVATEPKAPAVEAKAQVSGQWGEISAHVRDRRMARAEASPRGGLTSKQRKALAAELRSELGREYTAAEWTRACKAFKKAGRHA